MHLSRESWFSGGRQVRSILSYTPYTRRLTPTCHGLPARRTRSSTLIGTPPSPFWESASSAALYSSLVSRTEASIFSGAVCPLASFTIPLFKSSVHLSWSKGQQPGWVPAELPLPSATLLLPDTPQPQNSHSTVSPALRVGSTTRASTFTGGQTSGEVALMISGGVARMPRMRRSLTTDSSSKSGVQAPAMRHPTPSNWSSLTLI